MKMLLDGNKVGGGDYKRNISIIGQESINGGNLRKAHRFCMQTLSQRLLKYSRYGEDK